MTDELGALIERLDKVRCDEWDSKPSNDDYAGPHFVTVLNGFTITMTGWLNSTDYTIEVSRRRVLGLVKDVVAHYRDARISELYDRVGTKLESYEKGLDEMWKGPEIRRQAKLKKEFLSTIGVKD